jgi:hypothetical protein
MYKVYLPSINKTIKYRDVIEEKHLSSIRLNELTDDELTELLSRSVGYAEDLILFEFESR